MVSTQIDSVAAFAALSERWRLPTCTPSTITPNERAPNCSTVTFGAFGFAAFGLRFDFGAAASSAGISSPSTTAPMTLPFGSSNAHVEPLAGYSSAGKVPALPSECWTATTASYAATYFPAFLPAFGL